MINLSVTYTEINYDYFKAKERAINTALDMVKARLEHYKNESEKILGNWSDADRERFKDWNNWHDLQYRLEQRLWDNYCNYQSYCFEKHGISVYNF